VAFDESTVSQIKADPKVFTQLLDHIHMSTEISIEVNCNSFKARSHHADDNLNMFPMGNSSSSSSSQINDSMRRAMSTGVNLDTQEFDVFDIKSQYPHAHDEDATEVLIFCIKEFRALLGFCEAQDLSDFQLLFTRTGKPLKMCCRPRHCEVSVVMSTLMPQMRDNEVVLENDANVRVSSRDRTAVDSATAAVHVQGGGGERRSFSGSKSKAIVANNSSSRTFAGTNSNRNSNVDTSPSESHITKSTVVFDDPSIVQEEREATSVSFDFSHHVTTSPYEANRRTNHRRLGNGNSNNRDYNGDDDDDDTAAARAIMHLHDSTVTISDTINEQGITGHSKNDFSTNNIHGNFDENMP
jgi:hypothetical protein